MPVIVKVQVPSLNVAEDNTVEGHSYRLLELSPELQECIKDGVELRIKGNADDELVLCSEDRTFRVRQVQTSNLNMLITRDTGIVETMTNTILEATRAPPQLERLRRWLEACPYEGPTETTHCELLERLHCKSLFGEIQASDEEIRSALADLSAVLIEGYYRILGAEYTCRIFRTLFSSLTLLELRATEAIATRVITEEIFMESSAEFPSKVLEHFFTTYGRFSQDKSSLQMDATRVCRFFVRELLRARSAWNLSDLVKAWSKLTGDFVPVPREMLHGLALIEPIPGDLDFRVSYFPASTLPVDPISRFTKLFERCERWEYSVLEPFIKDSAEVLGVGVADLIVKYGRISVDPISQKKIVTPLLAPM